MQHIIQQVPTGSAIASAAVLASIGYGTAKKVANTIGIHASDARL